MREIIKRGKSISEIVEIFCKENNTEAADVKYTVERKGSKGLFGLWGKKEAIVKFIMPDVEDIIKNYLKTLLKHLGISYDNIDVKTDRNTFYTHIVGVDNPGFLIGKEGKMLGSIQLLLNKVVDDKERRNDSVVLDIDNYRAKHGKTVSKSKPEDKRNNRPPTKTRNTKPTDISKKKPRPPKKRNEQ